MSKIITAFALLAFIFLMIAGLWVLTAYYADLPQNISQHETIIVGQNRFTPGSQAAVRVLVRDSKDASPLAGAAIAVSMRPAAGGKAIQLFSGVTDHLGTANVAFDVPETADPSQNLIVATKSSLGEDTIERAVTVARDYRVLLTTDKPLYQPGQIIRLRLLALGSFDLRPAVAQSLEVVIADGKGNKVFRQTLTTSEFGVASTDFQLASEVNTGPYKITATLGNTSSEKTVTVDHYVLPKFDVEMTTERPYYQPGQHVVGSLSANYFFGKPVAGGTILVEGYTFDVAKTVVFSLQGMTDESGDYEFEFDLPGYIAGTELEGGMGRFYLQATVTDLAQHAEISNLSLPVAQSTLLIEAIPEGGQFRQGVENILYVLTSYPDGAPAEASVTVTIDSGQQFTAETGAYGLAEIAMTPQSPYQYLYLQATDSHGNTVQRELYFEGEWFEETVLLRPEQPIYRVGDAMALTILTSQPQGTVYLDIVREGQTVSTRAVEVTGGRAEVVVDLTPDLYGTLELHAYKLLSSGSITRDTRLVVVDHADELNVSISAGSDTYRPGDTAGVDVQVSGQDGGGASSAIGLAIVDESVFELAEQDPGFAKLYFMLESELLQPKYELHGLSIPDLVSPAGSEITDPTLRDAVGKAAQASLAAAAPSAGGFTLDANSHNDAMQRAYTRQQTYFAGLSKAMYSLFVFLPFMAILLSFMAIWREKSLWRSVSTTLLFSVAALLVFLLWPVSDSWLGQTILGRITIFANWVGESAIAVLWLIALAAWATLAIYALRRREWLLAGIVVILPLAALAAGFMVFALGRAGLSTEMTVIAWGLAAFGALLLAFLLRSVGYAFDRKMVPAVAALALALALTFGGLPALAQVAQSNVYLNDGFAGGMNQRVVAVEVEWKAFDAALPPMAPAPTAAPAMADERQESGGGAAGASEPPRLRQYFPETMLWLPDAVTDENGFLHLDFPVADSITTWRMTALASTQDGRLGSATAGLRVFQDFFIDLDLPLALTVGDEVSVPVGVFNYLADAQTVRLELTPTDWFDLLDEATKEITIGGNDITVVYFRIRAKDFGANQQFTVTAYGSQMSDAIQKPVRVYPNGMQIPFAQSDRLTAGEPVQQTISIPADAIPGTQSLVVKIYPGVVSQVVEGLDSLLRMPNGCFEQTSSTTYPNVMVLDYLKTTNQTSPEVQMKAEEYINLGYQRLTTFEVSGGGFSLFGEAPADPMLTAYGIMEFNDMSRVHDVDPDLIRRTAEWLMNQQSGDGSWQGLEGFHESTLTGQTDRLPVTAYIVWALADAGFGSDGRVEQGVSYLRENSGAAEDAYILALVTNALVAADTQSSGKVQSATQAVLDRLAAMATVDGNVAYWETGGETMMGGYGQAGNLETTALAALALLRADSHPDIINAAPTFLVKGKDSFGTWETTQATVMALKALLQSVRMGAENVDAAVTVTLNGSQAHTVSVTPENFDVVQLISFSDVNPGENVVSITVEGKGNLMYQISGSYYLPWEKLVEYPELAGGEELVSIDLSYDRTELAVNDTVGVAVMVTLNQQGAAADQAIIDLGLPPGFTVSTEDLDALVAYYNDVPEDYAFPTIERYELTGRQIILYVRNLSYGNPLHFTYHLQARFPLVAQTFASNAYDYYNPSVNGGSAPVVLTVEP